MLATLSAGSVLADNVNNFGDTRGGALAGPMGLFIIILLGIATVLLIRNMNKRLRRLPASFEGQEPTRSADTDAVENSLRDRDN
jgi:hypothetical protein